MSVAKKLTCSLSSDKTGLVCEECYYKNNGCVIYAEFDVAKKAMKKYCEGLCGDGRVECEAALCLFYRFIKC